MTKTERIKLFNEGCFPFNITDMGKGEYCLGLLLFNTPDELYPYCQNAFDRYALEINKPIENPYGRKTFGSGNDWQDAFEEAFKDDIRLKLLKFDSESDGMYCYSRDLDSIIDFGTQFKEICEDEERFFAVVREAIPNAAQRRAEEKRLSKTVKGQLMENPNATFDIRSPLGDIRITPEISQQLLSGDANTIVIGDCRYATWELLDQPLLKKQTDIFCEDVIRLITDEAPELLEDTDITM